MSSSEPINLSEMLRDVHLPSEVGLWPVAPAWWALLLTLVGLLFILWCWRRRAQEKRVRNRYRVSAVHELELLVSDWRETQDMATYLAGVNAVLKRCCLTRQPMLSLAQPGAKWAEILSEFCPHTLSSESQQALIVGLYQVAPQVNVEQLHSEACQWVKRHRLPKYSDQSQLAAGEPHV